jgi:energy-coupling factor transporter ATP-binding protein EcfA2
MTLLEFREVCKRTGYAGREVVVLDRATLRIDAGELVALWGLRHSGRTTLLRLAAGIDAPESGTVRFDGRDLAEHNEDLLGSEISYCQEPFRDAGAQTVTHELIVGLLVNGFSRRNARERAAEMLERVGAAQLATRRISELDAGERIRVAIADSLSMAPRLLVIDEPVAGVELHDRDGILLLLRALADQGTAVLMSVGDTTGLTGADQALTIGDGELSGSVKQRLAPVIDLRPAASG